jgi:hypothetical protein
MKGGFDKSPTLEGVCSVPEPPKPLFNLSAAYLCRPLLF